MNINESLRIFLFFNIGNVIGGLLMFILTNNIRTKENRIETFKQSTLFTFAVSIVISIVFGFIK
jgi:hypothetical protein